MNGGKRNIILMSDMLCSLKSEQFYYQYEQRVKLTDEYLLPRLPEQCVTIAIPNLFSLGNMLLPEVIANRCNFIFAGKGIWSIFRSGPKYIINALENGQEKSKIIEVVMTGQLYSKEMMQDNFGKAVHPIFYKNVGC